MNKKQKLRIDVGGGLYPKPGFINVDLYAEGPAVLKYPAWDLPYKTGEVDEINCSHALEHVEKRKVIPVLREFHRVLKPEGLLVIEVPDLVWCVENWLKIRDDGWALDAIFGNQDPPGGQFHYTGFTQEILQNDLTLAGFEKAPMFYAPWSHEQRCLHFEVFK